VWQTTEIPQYSLSCTMVLRRAQSRGATLLGGPWGQREPDCTLADSRPSLQMHRLLWLIFVSTVRIVIMNDGAN
jgi:hypothetical protein